MSDSRKQSLYFTNPLLGEIEYEAARLDRSLSWVVAYGLRNQGLSSLRKLPSMIEVVKRTASSREVG